MKRIYLMFALAAVTLPGCGGGGGGSTPPAPPPPVVQGGGGDAPAPTVAEGGDEPAPAAAPMSGQSVSGVAKFDGTAPARTDLAMIMMPMPECADLHTGPVLDESAVVSADGNVANVFVYVSAGLPSDQNYSPAANAKAAIDQNGCVYAPHVQGMMVGQTLSVINSDSTMHNINCQAKLNSAFNWAQPIPGTRVTSPMRRAEMAVRFKCDVHPWMGAWIHVMDHPFFATTDESGAFTIDNLPAGTYTMTAWHETFGSQTFEVTVGDEDVTGAEVTFTGGLDI